MPRRPGRAHRIHVMRLHLPARDHVAMDWAPALYVIRVDGQLGAMTLSAFPGMTPQRRGKHTVFTGWLDHDVRDHAVDPPRPRPQRPGPSLTTTRQDDPALVRAPDRDHAPGPGPSVPDTHP